MLMVDCNIELYSLYLLEVIPVEETELITDIYIYYFLSILDIPIVDYFV